MNVPGGTGSRAVGVAELLSFRSALPFTMTVTVLLVQPAGMDAPVQERLSETVARSSRAVSPFGSPVAEVAIWKPRVALAPTARSPRVQLRVLPETEGRMPPVMLPGTYWYQGS